MKTATSDKGTQPNKERACQHQQRGAQARDAGARARAAQDPGRVVVTAPAQASGSSTRRREWRTDVRSLAARVTDGSCVARAAARQARKNTSCASVASVAIGATRPAAAMARGARTRTHTRGREERSARGSELSTDRGPCARVMSERVLSPLPSCRCELSLRVGHRRTATVTRGVQLYCGAAARAAAPFPPRAHISHPQSKASIC
jgi:hypothetical protein